jgi:broad specificity phosphatase PhoE
MLTIYFITHATSLDNEAKRASGHYDVALSPTGESQAREAGLRYADQVFNAVFCSDLQRSYQTAAIAFAGRHLNIIQDARLRECDYGDLTRHPTAEIEAWRVRAIAEKFPNGESYQDCVERMRSFLADLKRDFADKTVLIVGHRATHYALDHLLNGKTLHEAITQEFVWQPGWVFKIQIDHGTNT